MQASLIKPRVCVRVRFFFRFIVRYLSQFLVWFARPSEQYGPGVSIDRRSQRQKYVNILFLFSSYVLIFSSSPLRLTQCKRHITLCNTLFAYKYNIIKTAIRYHLFIIIYLNIVILHGYRYV